MTTYIVSSGQVSSGITLSSGDTETVLSGGIAFDTTIDSAGSLTVSSGGTASYTMINSGGRETVSSGGLDGSATINGGGVLTVLSGITYGYTINSGGSLLVNHTANNGTIYGGGSEIVSSGGGGGGTALSGGSLTVLSGGVAYDDTIDSGGSLTVLSGGITGIVEFLDEGDTINNAGSETVSSGGIAVGTAISSGGSFVVAGTATNATVHGGGSLTVLSGGSAISATVSSGGSLTVLSGGSAISATVSSGGSLTVLSGGTTISPGGNGSLLVAGFASYAAMGSETVLSGGVASFDGSVSETVSSGGTTVSPGIGAGAVLDLLSGAIVSGGITFGGSGGQLQIGGSAMPANTISGFVPGDTFDLRSIAFDSHGSANLGTGDVLQITEGGNTYDFNLFQAQFYTGDVFHLASDGSSGTLVTETTTPCYCRGTMILTETGEMPVEDLAIGDKVTTISGEAKPIVWIGRRSYAGRFAFGQRHILPVCVTRGALADGVPQRDLWVSPNHALYLEGVLIEARDLINGVSIVQAERVATIEYFHIELDSHDVIVAEGAAAESFIDDDSRLLFHNAHEYRPLYPDAATGPARYCAPRRDQGWGVERARATIARRAGLPVSVEAPPLGGAAGRIAAPLCRRGDGRWST